MQIEELSSQKFNALNDWYWRYGSKRTGIETLSKSSWLAKLHRTWTQYESAKDSKENFRPAVALWGPSQAGKSTLLASFIDAGEGALSWSGKFSFSARKGNCLNPYNRGRDASGCVTRYVMRAQVEHPQTPVEVRFAKERDIFMSLAFGYLSETDGRKPDGGREHLDLKRIEEILEECNEQFSARDADPELFPGLIAITDVLEALVFSHSAQGDRYINLEKDWKQVRGKIIDCDVLLSSQEAQIAFASKLFWDAWGSLSNICKKLLKTQRQVENRIGGKKCYCSLNVASVFLDITAATNPDHKGEIGQIGWEMLPSGDWALCKGTGAFDDEENFAFVQGLVSVLIVPLKESVIKESQALFELMSKADLIDFPGVSNEDKAAECALLKDEDIRNNEIENGLTKVLKRGKTSSIVIGYSRNLDIDVFTILLRMAEDKFPSKPEQLNAGISAWFYAMLKKPFDKKTANELPLNVVQTFAMEFIETVQKKSLGESGLRDIFKKYESIGTLGNPECVKFFSINYPKWRPIPQDIDKNQLQKYVEEIENDETFRRYYKYTKESLRQMCGLLGPDEEDGGRSYLFKQLKQQISSSQRSILLGNKKRELQQELNSLLERALPPEGSEREVRERDIKEIKNKLEDDARWNSKAIANALKKLLHIPASALPRLPERLFSDSRLNRSEALAYAQTVFAKVQEFLMAATGESALGLTGEIHGRFVRYLTELISEEKIIAWLNNNCEMLSDRSNNPIDPREDFSTYVGTRLLSGSHGHPSPEEAQTLLEKMSNAPDSYENLPEYRSIISPFLNTLDDILKNRASGRKAQPGDNELGEIIR